MPTYDYSGEKTLKCGTDIFHPGKRTISKQFITNADLNLISTLPLAETIPFGNSGKGRRVVILAIDNNGEVPIGPYADEFILRASNGGSVTISGEVYTNGFSDGQRVTLRGTDISGETVVIKNGSFYKTSLSQEIALIEGDLLELEYIKSKDIWAEVTYQPF